MLEDQKEEKINKFASLNTKHYFTIIYHGDDTAVFSIILS
jgi:hypothetical protein